MTLAQLLLSGGRKYAVVVRTLELGFALALLGLVVAMVRPAIAQYVAAIVGSFGVLGSASIIAYQGANAYKGRNETPSAPRPSGSIPTPDGQ
jgi:hypothetical protein